jgi:hypothetical protein
VANPQHLNLALSGKTAWNHWAASNQNSAVDFSGHVFNSAVDFKGFTFPGEANFSGCQFLATALFSGATFVGKADFSHAIFKEYVALDRITFQNDAIFEHAHFRQHAYVVHAKFTHANFTSATFHGVCELTGSTFSGETDFTGATFEDDPIFKGVQFKHPLTTFASATFNNVPDFRNSGFEFSPILYGIGVGDPKTNRAAEAEDADKYRRLKVLAADAKDYQGELRFFADELRAKRGYETEGWWAIRLNKLYERSSNFGQSVARPFGWLVGLILLSGVVRVGACLPSSLGAIGPHFAMALADTALLVGSDKWELRMNALPEAVKACSFDYGLLQHVAALLQSGLGLVLLFLVGLGLRNRFRIGGGN